MIFEAKAAFQKKVLRARPHKYSCMALGQSLQQKLLQKLSPQQIQLMKLLQVPTANLEERIKEELEENPALEVTEEDHEDGLTDDSKDEFESTDEKEEKDGSEDEYENIDI